MMYTVKCLCEVTNDTSHYLFIKAFNTSFIGLQTAFSVVNPLQNPYSSLLMMMFLCKWSSILVCITFSKIFEKEVKRDTGL